MQKVIDEGGSAMSQPLSTPPETLDTQELYRPIRCASAWGTIARKAAPTTYSAGKTSRQRWIVEINGLAVKFPMRARFRGKTAHSDIEYAGGAERDPPHHYCR
jgi:hypothetical protein